MTDGGPMPDAPPLRTPGSRAVVLMAAAGIVTGLVSSLPTPLPTIRLADTGLILNAKHFPLHAGAVFGAALGFIMWLKVTRDAGKCALAALLTLIGWLAATNTANDVFQMVIASELFGTIEGAKEKRQIAGLLLGGAFGGAVGAGLTAFGCGIPGEPLRKKMNWILVVIVGAAAGVLLCPAGALNALIVLFVPWQASVAAAIGLGLVRT